MKIKKQFYLILFTGFFTGVSWGQQNTVGSGGEASGSGGTVSYTIGQIGYTSETGTNGSVSQGVQQPITAGTSNLIENEKEFSVLLFPNPTVAELHVEMKEVDLNQLAFMLTDATGKELQTLQIKSDKITINMADFNRGNYFLNFIKEGKVVGSYTVVKN